MSLGNKQGVGWGGGGLTKKTVIKCHRGGEGGEESVQPSQILSNVNHSKFFCSHFFCKSIFTVLCVRACVRACVRLRPSIVKALSIWGWNSRGEINDVVLKTFLSSAKYLHRYFSMKHRAVLTGRFILFTI